ncbi:MAG: DUF2782 domain-containing protein [Candidatus Promineifilaceae bacterium]
MSRFSLLFVLLSLAVFTTCIVAADNRTLAETGDSTDRQQPPPPRPGTDSDKLPEPPGRVIKNQNRPNEENRVKGALRYIKVIPNQGPPYYFVDTNGDGVLDQQFSSLDNPPLNQWILFRW